MANKIHEKNVNKRIDLISEKIPNWNPLKELPPNINDPKSIAESLNVTKKLIPTSNTLIGIAGSMDITRTLTPSINKMAGIIDNLNISKDLITNMAKFDGITDSLKITSDLCINIADRLNITKGLVPNLSKFSSITDSLNVSAAAISSFADSLKVPKDLIPSIAASFNIVDSLNIAKGIISTAAISERVSKFKPNTTEFGYINNAYVQIKDVVNAIDINNVSISKDDLSNDVLIKEAVNFVDETFDTIENTENWQQTIKDKVDKFKEANPVYAFILSLIISIFIQNAVLEPAMNYIKDNIKKIYSEDTSYSTRRKEVRRILEFNYSTFNESILNRFRVLNKDNISIRINHYRNSYSVVTANKGSIITLLSSKKNYDKRRFKNWLYVEYEAPDGIVYQGWVNNIYTSKVR